MSPGGAGPGYASGMLGVRIFLLMAAGYLMSYGLRAINATIAPELSAELGLSNASLGTLTSAYFVGFAAMQIPVGIWLDRFGPRRVNASLMVIAGIGCLMLAAADSLQTLWFARMITGVGFAAGLMSAYAMFRLWFEPGVQTRLAAWILMCGTIGVLIATMPVRWALPLIGWRGIFVACGFVLILIGVAIWFGLPKQREPDGQSRQSFLSALAGYRHIVGSPFFWRMVIASGMMQGAFIALQTLWLGPWLVQVLGYTPDRAAQSLFFFNGTLLLAYLFNGWLAPLLGTSLAMTIRTVAIAMPISFGLLGLIAGAPATAGLWAWMLLAGVNTVFTPVQARVGLAFPARMSGRALTAFNLVVFIGVVVVQSVLGVVIDWLIASGHGAIDAFRLSLGLVVALQVLAWVVFLGWRSADRPAEGLAA